METRREKTQNQSDWGKAYLGKTKEGKPKKNAAQIGWWRLKNKGVTLRGD